MTRRAVPPMTEAEKRVYQRGYNRGRTRASDMFHRMYKLAKEWRAKAIAGSCTGVCENCALWEKQSQTTRWGICGQIWETVIEGYAWAEINPYVKDAKARLVTQSDFGCVTFRVKPLEGE